ncbi:MAG: family 10 glycosylhydrolase [Clostridia bacterium]|nr:family 10 glycosylhydrolase [Clostridia bacterium]
MKRFILVLLLIFFLFCACVKTDDLSPYVNETVLQTQQTYAAEKETTEKLKAENYVSFPAEIEATAHTAAAPENTASLFSASWLSYIELSLVGGRNTKESYTAYIDGIFDNMKKVNITDVFVQVRPFADAFYPSDYFPATAYAASEQGGTLPFDVFGLIVERAKLKGLNIHAWINPYRVSHGNDIKALSEKNPARMMFKEGISEDVAVTEKGIYFNPASEKVRKLITDGVKELLKKYDIKGIHIDDYFYFENCGDFDSRQYSVYTSLGGSLDLAEWRRENVSTLLSTLYSAVKAFGEEKIFSVSPAGDIAKCYNESYADVYLWCREEGYCDMIIPQIYFGFDHGKLPFTRCLEDWTALCMSGKVKLTVGLALYKAGQEDAYALSGKDEWVKNHDIIARQVQLIRDKGCYGYALYSGAYIDFFEKSFAEELNNLKTMVY